MWLFVLEGEPNVAFVLEGEPNVAFSVLHSIRKSPSIFSIARI